LYKAKFWREKILANFTQFAKIFLSDYKNWFWKLSYREYSLIYYLPIIADSSFTKIFLLHNFVSYGMYVIKMYLTQNKIYVITHYWLFAKQQAMINTTYQTVTGFAKRGLPHTSNFLTLTIHNFLFVRAIELKFLQR